MYEGGFGPAVSFLAKGKTIGIKLNILHAVYTVASLGSLCTGCMLYNCEWMHNTNEVYYINYVVHVTIV